uniref:Uncharacterized protein n=1 Tax=Anguilla anguilla TaxID=7936 RepID=A0A0E9S2L7_ANGAN
MAHASGINPVRGTILRGGDAALLKFR